MKNVRIVFHKKGHSADATNEITLHQMVVVCRPGDPVSKLLKQISAVAPMFLGKEQLSHQFGLFVGNVVLKSNTLISELPAGTLTKTIFYKEIVAQEGSATPVLARRSRARKAPLLRKSSRDGEKEPPAAAKNMEQAVKPVEPPRVIEAAKPVEAAPIIEAETEDDGTFLPSMDEFFSDHKTIRLKPDMETMRRGGVDLLDWERSVESMLDDLPKNSSRRKTGELAPELQSIFDFLEASDEEEEDNNTPQPSKTNEKVLQMPLERVKNQGGARKNRSKRLSVFNLKFQ